MSRKKCYEELSMGQKRKTQNCFTPSGEMRHPLSGAMKKNIRSVSRLFLKQRAPLALLAAAIALVACGRKHPHVANVPSTKPSSAKPSVAIAPGYTEEGIASWYGPPYHGRAAADGEIYDMETLVAAHREMPFNTWLRVTNTANGKTVTVRVIDRGPFVAGRILDLSKAAARQIDLLGPGIGRVRLEVIAAPADVPANDFYAVQVGAFAVRQNAERVRDQLAQKYGPVQLAVKQGPVPLWRVLVGKESSTAAAQQLANKLIPSSNSVFVVRLDETIVNPANNPPVATLPGEPAPADGPHR
jgi:rare lipoprotein A